MTEATRARLFGAGWAVVFAVAYAAVSLLRFRSFAPSSYDNAIFEQAVRGYAGLGAPIVDIKGPGYNLLGDHFSPVLVVIAPFYRVFPSAQTILIAQAVLLAISVAVVATLAVRRLGALTGSVVAVTYGLSFGLQSAVEADFHEVAFGAPLLALAGAAYVDRRYRAVVVWSLPLLLVKEDLGLTVAAVGGVLWLAGERRRGAALAAGGLVAAAVVVLVIVPAFNPGDAYAYSSALGGDRGIWATLLDAPGRKVATVALTIGVTGLAALASPWALLALPTFAWRFAGDNPYYWGTEFHYSLLLMPIVFIAMVDAMVRRPPLRWAAVAGVIVTAVTVVGSPIWGLVDGAAYRESPRADTAREVLALIPDDTSVETDIALMKHLVTDRTVYWVGSVGDAIAEYVLFDASGGLGSPEDIVRYAEQAHGGTYDLVYDHDGYLLAQRR